ncbi:hypothetical protein [Aridibaculum aurantiacum]|uniref:hypothetical protein n=1 Tax=Aridibaculum aurantiacum TaxID=2810307 RepID=UPI001A96F66E|nr:hypothetical protein [Aridibaculum aurantiacum]
MRRTIVIALIALAVSCKNKPATEPKADTATAATNIYQEDSTLIVSAGINDWMQQTLKAADLPAKMKLEEFWKDDSLMVSPFTPSNEFYSDYAPVLRWSADSNYIIDIGSYGTVVTKNAQGKTQLEAGSPDSELALIEPKKQERTRLMFVGPSSEIINAKWIDSRQALVIGTFDKTGNDNHDTLLWMIDVKDKFFRLYNIKSHR